MERDRDLPPPLARSNGDGNSADGRALLAFTALAEGSHNVKAFPASKDQGEVS